MPQTGYLFGIWTSKKPGTHGQDGFSESDVLYRKFCLVAMGVGEWSSKLGESEGGAGRSSGLPHRGEHFAGG